MSDEFFSDEELRSPAYKACVGLATIAGLASGSLVAGVVALPSGGASLILGGIGAGMGAYVGKRLCPGISERMVQKLTSSDAALSPAELQQMVRGLRRSSPKLSTQQALNEIASTRLAALRKARV
jgi:hypothetical protein